MGYQSRSFAIVTLGLRRISWRSFQKLWVVHGLDMRTCISSGTNGQSERKPSRTLERYLLRVRDRLLGMVGRHLPLIKFLEPRKSRSGEIKKQKETVVFPHQEFDGTPIESELQQWEREDSIFREK
ncbi:hypothetical protein Tco_0750080 [Tanacetum coccineum]|uniref:Ribosomal protein S3 n=1 Tax=Tanacetum coccineum TaxID=301880 RepID=A0ABQ4Z076_9ASTR